MAITRTPTQRRVIRGMLCTLAVIMAPIVAAAQSLIRDAEIEYALRELSRPIAVAAGLSPSQLNILVVNDSSLNAFVADHRTIFVHSGLLMKLDSGAQIQSVLAHEMAHIANGHITRRVQNYQNSSRIAAIGTALSAAAAIGGGGSAAVGLAAGTSSAAQRAFFAHTRAEESSADQAGVRYMARAGVDPHAMTEVLDIFRGQEALSASRQDPYVLTHPLSRDRIRALNGIAAAVSVQPKDTSTAEYWFARAKGKLGAFLQNPSFTLRKLDKKDQSDIATMMRAVAYHRKPDTKEALKYVDRLVAMNPNDPYAHELRGQILLESRNFGAAVNAYGRAVKLAPSEALILSGYGRALLATESNDKAALSALERARARDPYDPRMLRDLAVAYARTGNNGMASVATAERYAILGRLKDAAVHAKRATGLLPRGSAGYLRAQDILAAAKNRS